MKEVQRVGVEVEVRGKEVQQAHLSMLDGKMISTLLSLGGGYCTQCTVSLDGAQHLDTIVTGFFINISLGQTTNIAVSLMHTRPRRW